MPGRRLRRVSRLGRLPQSAPRPCLGAAALPHSQAAHHLGRQADTVTERARVLRCMHLDGILGLGQHEREHMHRGARLCHRLVERLHAFDALPLLRLHKVPEPGHGLGKDSFGSIRRQDPRQQAPVDQDVFESGKAQACGASCAARGGLLCCHPARLVLLACLLQRQGLAPPGDFFL